MHHNCSIPKIDKELEANGNWKVVAGVEGKTAEINFNVEVAAKGKWYFNANVTNDLFQVELEYHLYSTSVHFSVNCLLDNFFVNFLTQLEIIFLCKPTYFSGRHGDVCSV